MVCASSDAKMETSKNNNWQKTIIDLNVEKYGPRTILVYVQIDGHEFEREKYGPGTVYFYDQNKLHLKHMIIGWFIL